MRRRDFLLLKTEGRLQVADLSCERLYLQSVDARVSGGEPNDAFDPAEGGEPPEEIARPTRIELLRSLEADLATADLVRVGESQWLAAMEPEWRSGIERLLGVVRERGARVEEIESVSVIDEPPPSR